MRKIRDIAREASKPSKPAGARQAEKGTLNLAAAGKGAHAGKTDKSSGRAGAGAGTYTCPLFSST